MERGGEGVTLWVAHAHRGAVGVRVGHAGRPATPGPPRAGCG